MDNKRRPEIHALAKMLKKQFTSDFKTFKNSTEQCLIDPPNHLIQNDTVVLVSVEEIKYDQHLLEFIKSKSISGVFLPRLNLIYFSFNPKKEAYTDFGTMKRSDEHFIIFMRRRNQLTLCILKVSMKLLTYFVLPCSMKNHLNI